MFCGIRHRFFPHNATTKRAPKSLWRHAARELKGGYCSTIGGGSSCWALLGLLVVLAWVLSGLIRGPCRPLSRPCTKFLQTHSQNSKPIPIPSALAAHPFLHHPRYLVAAPAPAAAATVLVHHHRPTCVYPWPLESVRSRRGQLQYRIGPAWSELPAPDVDIAKLRYNPRHAFRRSTPADPGKVCQAGASEQTLIPISLIFQHWPPRPSRSQSPGRVPLSF